MRVKLRTSCSDQSPSFLRSEPLSSTRRVLPARSSDFAWRCTDPQTRAALCAELSRERLPARQRSAACVILPSLRACAASFRVFNDRVVLLTPRERHCPLLARRRNSFPVSRADAAGFLPGRSLGTLEFAWMLSKFSPKRPCRPFHSPRNSCGGRSSGSRLLG